jgi:glycosyltransferase involved in cell wall biosynthesis
LTKKNIANATVIHSKFLEDAYNLKSPPQPFYKFVCENRKAYDGIAILTKQEAADFLGKYGPQKNIYVIGHPYPFPVEPVEFSTRDHKKAVAVARFDPVKRLDLMVEIFALVLKEVPDATLEIYGFGNEEKKIKEKIAALGAGENIKLMGFTNQAAKIMSEAACYLMTSNIEGLPLTLLEASSNGAPNFAFDIKYGPAAIIKPGVTGYLFKEGDKKGYARALIKFFKDPGIQRRMVDNCYDNAPSLGVAAFLEKWLAFTRVLYDKIVQKDGGE